MKKKTIGKTVIYYGTFADEMKGFSMRPGPLMEAVIGVAIVLTIIAGLAFVLIPVRYLITFFGV